MAKGRDEDIEREMRDKIRGGLLPLGNDETDGLLRVTHTVQRRCERIRKRQECPTGRGGKEAR